MKITPAKIAAELPRARLSENQRVDLKNQLEAVDRCIRETITPDGVVFRTTCKDPPVIACLLRALRRAGYQVVVSQADIRQNTFSRQNEHVGTLIGFQPTDDCWPEDEVGDIGSSSNVH